MNNEMLQIAGLDIGNGYVKGSAGPYTQAASGIDFPSGAAYMMNPHDIKTTGAAVPKIIENIFNEMDATFDSPLVKDQTRRLFGTRGINSGCVMEEFDVYSNLSKAKQPLSAVLVLGSVAGKALQNYWAENQSLPTDILHVHARVALSLPIMEYKQYRKSYAAGFMGSTHMVSIHNFEQIVRIEITFDDVQVIAEGASAMYAITARGVELMNVMLADVRRLGEPLPGITAEDILAAENTVGIDIGEGTVNFPVFQMGRFNPDASITYNKGYGSVLTGALARLEEAGMPMQSRKALTEFLQRQPSKLAIGRYNMVKHIVEQEMVGFAKNVVMQFRNVMSNAGVFTDVVYVYGGGATPLKEVLHPLLLEASRSMGGSDVACPILYLDSRYSRYLNREGLYIMANSYANTVLGQSVSAS